MLSRISQIQKDRYCIIALCEILRRLEIYRNKVRLVITRGVEEKGEKGCCLMDTGLLEDCSGKE